jgi:hypothetical protein
MHSHLDDAVAQHSAALASWNECRAEARQIEDPTERAAALAALRRERPRHPYLGGISLTALGLGNRLIIRTLKPHASKVRVTRQQVWGAVGLAAFLSPVLARPVARYAPTTLTVLLVLWVVVAVVLGNTDAAAEPVTESTTPEEGRELAATEATEDPDEPDERTEFLSLLHRLMPGTEPGKNDRIHLVQIAAAWTGEEGADTAPIRTLLATLNIPITDCRVPGRGPSKGIYLRDVPPLPGPDRQPLAGVVAEPDQQQQQQQRSAAAIQKGFWTKDDPDSPNHSIVDWEKAS